MSFKKVISHDFITRVYNFCSRIKQKGLLLDLPEAGMASLEANYAALNDKSNKVILAAAYKTKVMEERSVLIDSLWHTITIIITDLQNRPQWTTGDAKRLKVHYKKNRIRSVATANFGFTRRHATGSWPIVLDWINNFLGRVTDMHHLGDLPMDRIRQLQAICEESALAMEKTGLAVEQWQQSINDRQACGEAVIPVVRTLFAQLAELPKWTKEDILDLGFSNWYSTNGYRSINTIDGQHVLRDELALQIREILSHESAPTRLLLPGYKPAGSATLYKNRVRIKLEKGDVSGMLVFTRLQGQANFTLLGYTKNYIFYDYLPVTGNHEEIREYCLKGLIKNDEVGQFSDVFSITVHPPAPAAEDCKPAIRVRETGQNVRIETVKIPGYSMNVYTRTDAETAFTFLGHAPRRGCLIDARPLKKPYTAERRYYYLVLVKDGKEMSLSSDIHNILFDAQHPDFTKYKPMASFTRTRDAVIIHFRKETPWNIGMNIYTRMQQETAFILLAHAAKEALYGYNLTYKDTRPHIKGDTRVREYKLRGVADGHEIGQDSDVYTVLMGE